MTRSDRFAALVDACVLAGVLKRDFILSLAEAGLFRLHWSATILDETERAILKITDGKADTPKQRKAMEEAFPDAMVKYAPDVAGMIALPDPKDIHVLAAEIAIKADVIVTDNLKDFPAKVLASFGLEAKSSDDFIADCLDLGREEAFAAIGVMRSRFKRPEITAQVLVDKAEKRELKHTAVILRKNIHLI